MRCEGCEIDLPPGAAHLNADACVAALKHALVQATTCQACHEHVPVVAHAPCFMRIVQARAGNAVLDNLEKRAARWLQEKLTGDGSRGERGDRDEDSDPPEERGGRRRFVP